MNHWELIKVQLQTRLPNESYCNWIQPTAAASEAEGIIRVNVPDEATRMMLQEDYSDLLTNTAAHLGIPLIK